MILCQTVVPTTIEPKSCKINNGGCNINANCIEIGNGFIQCSCKYGYAGNGINCVEINYPNDIKCNGDGISCYPNNCCPFLLNCYHDGGSSAIQQTSAGTVCMDGLLVHENGVECMNTECNMPGVCGDGICDLMDTINCLEDCGGAVECGDGICSNTESCFTCESDCGVCPTYNNEGSECPEDNVCSENAVCTLLFNGAQNCKCNEGYTGNGRECYPKIGCDGLEDGSYCYPEDCCSRYYTCYNGKYELMGEYKIENVVCFNGTSAWKDGEECADKQPVCNENTCGNGVCDPDETCLTCPTDCGLCMYCGDGVCTDYENCVICPEDCGSCNGNDGSECGPNNGGCDVNANCYYGFNKTITCGCKEGYSGNGKVCHKIEAPDNYNCYGKEDGVHCLGDNCCPYIFHCSFGKKTPIQKTYEGTVCYNGEQVFPSDEECVSYEANCPTEPVCGDGICYITEVGHCPDDCGEVVCGDEVCSSSENCYSCPGDCGNCRGDDDEDLPTKAPTVPDDNSTSLCSENNGGCDENADCYVLDNGHVKCVCKTGYTGNGQECHTHNTCEGRPNAAFCIKDCCNKYYSCWNGVASVVMETYPNTLCYEGIVVNDFDPECANKETTCIFECGDGICNLDETCSNCPTDCGTCIECGDNICSKGETCTNCPADCGTCNSNAEIANEISNENQNSKKTNYTPIIIIGSVCGILLIGSVILVMFRRSKKEIKTITL